MVHKYYLLEVYGDIKYRVEKNGLVIDFPIAHHKFAPEKMVVIDNEDKKNKADVRYHRVQTEIVEFQCCGAGVGKTVVMMELIHNIGTEHS